MSYNKRFTNLGYSVRTRNTNPHFYARPSQARAVRKRSGFVFHCTDRVTWLVNRYYRSYLQSRYVCQLHFCSDPNNESDPRSEYSPLGLTHVMNQYLGHKFTTSVKINCLNTILNRAMESHDLALCMNNLLIWAEPRILVLQNFRLLQIRGRG